MSGKGGSGPPLFSGMKYIPVFIILIVLYFMIMGFFPATGVTEGLFGPFGMTANQALVVTLILFIICLPFLFNLSSKRVWILLLLVILFGGIVFFFFP